MRGLQIPRQRDACLPPPSNLGCVARGAPSTVRERTGTLMQGLILLGVLAGLSLATIIASLREAMTTGGGAANASACGEEGA